MTPSCPSVCMAGSAVFSLNTKSRFAKAETLEWFAYLSTFSPVSTVLYGTSSPPETLDVPDCGPNTQTYPTLLPASLDWPLEEKELPDPFAFQVSQVHL